MGLGAAAAEVECLGVNELCSCCMFACVAPLVSQKETDFEATCKGQDLQHLFGLSPVAVGNNQPFFDVTLTVTRQVNACTHAYGYMHAFACLRVHACSLACMFACLHACKRLSAEPKSCRVYS